MPNKIGMFSGYQYHNKIWQIYSAYRGKYVFSKKPHYYNGSGIKKWSHKGRVYDNYESYLMAVIK